MNPLDGSGQITAIALVVAVIAYLRNVPIKDLKTFVDLAIKQGSDPAVRFDFSPGNAAHTRVSLRIAWRRSR